MSPRTLDRLIYIDDSGDPRTGLVVYGWIEFQPDHWHDVLGVWLQHRKQLSARYGVPVPKELHMTDYAQGRGNLTARKLPEFTGPNGSTFYKKDFGRAVARESLAVMRSLEGLRVGSVYRQATRETAAPAKAGLYAALLRRFETELQGTDSLAMIFMDGDGSDTTYRDAHRQLPRAARHVIEDPIYTDSKTSQLMQMADHVAWSAFATLARVPKHEFAHELYRDYLAVRDPSRGPQPL